MRVLICVSVFMLISLCFDYYSLQQYQKSGSMIPPVFFFFFSRLLWLLGDLLWFKANFRIVCSIPVYNAIEILIRIVLKSVGYFGQYGHLNSILPINDHGIFSLICVLPNFFINILQFSVYRSFNSLVNFVPRYFILFKAM